MVQIFGIIFASIVLITGCSNTTDTPTAATESTTEKTETVTETAKRPVPEGFVEYSNDGINASYPSDRRMDDSSSEVIVTFLSPLSNAEDIFSENINITTESLAGQDFTLTEYLDASIGNLKEAINEMNITSNESVTENGIEYRVITFTGKYEDTVLKWKQYFTIINNTAYILTLTGVDDDTFAAYDETLQTIVTSFSVTK